jgi:hypothetical protein
MPVAGYPVHEGEVGRLQALRLGDGEVEEERGGRGVQQLHEERHAWQVAGADAQAGQDLGSMLRFYEYFCKKNWR